MRRISDKDGNLVWSRDYYPFGESRQASGADEENKYTYEGKVEDPDEQSDIGEKDLEIGLWYNTARFFNDEGRFTQVDPLWQKYPSMSPYVRAANNPLKFVDPEGEENLIAQAGGFFTLGPLGGKVDGFAGIDIENNAFVIGFNVGFVAKNPKSTAPVDGGIYGGVSYVSGNIENGSNTFLLIDVAGDVLVNISTSVDNKELLKANSLSEVTDDFKKDGSVSVGVSKSITINPASTSVLGGMQTTQVWSFPFKNSNTNVEENAIFDMIGF